MSNTSSVIREIQHNADNNELRVTFRNGDTYAYPNVDRKVAEEFAQAPSKGRFFNQNLGAIYYSGRRV